MQRPVCGKLIAIGKEWQGKQHDYPPLPLFVIVQGAGALIHDNLI